MTWSTATKSQCSGTWECPECRAPNSHSVRPLAHTGPEEPEGDDDHAQPCLTLGHGGQVAVTFFTLSLLASYSFMKSAGGQGSDETRRAISFQGCLLRHPTVCHLMQGNFLMSLCPAAHGFITCPSQDTKGPAN